MKPIYTLFFSILMFCEAINAQGIIIKGDEVPPANENIEKLDPARYHKIQIIDIKVGTLNSDDRGFQSLLKYYGFKPGSRNFIILGADYNYFIKKINFGASINFSKQTKNQEQALKHSIFQGSIGYALLRHNYKIFTLKANIGLETSTFRFGNFPPDFLLPINYAHSESKLFQQQMVLGPSINYYRFFNKMQMDRGLSIGLEAGVNFAPVKATWKYGYDDENFDYIGNDIFEMPQAARQTYYTTLKIGFWAAK